MSVNIGDLVLRLRLSDEMSTKLDAAGKGLKDFGHSMLPISSAIGAVGVAGFKMANDLNRAMANVQTLIPGATERILQLKEGVKAVAHETGKSSVDIAGGLYQVVSANVAASEQMKFLEVASMAAAAGLSTTRESVNLLALVTKGYNDTSAEAAEKTANLAFLTVKLGLTTYPELAASMGAVVPIAKSLNVSQEELFASMATLTGATGDAAMVSTQLRSIMADMMKPSEEMSAAIEKLGYSGVQAMVSQLGLVGSMNALISKTDGSAEQIAKLFNNVRALPAVFALSGSQAANFSTKLGQMKDSAGEMKLAFDQQTQGVNAAGFAFEQFKHSAEGALRDVGDAIAPSLMAGMRALAPLIDALREAIRWLGQMPGPIRDVVVGMGVFVAAMGPVSIALGTMVSGLKAATLALGITATGFGMATIAVAEFIAVYKLTTWLSESIPWVGKVRDGIAALAMSMTGATAAMRIHNEHLEKGVDVYSRWTPEQQKAYKALLQSRNSAEAMTTATKGAAEATDKHAETLKREIEKVEADEQAKKRLAEASTKVGREVTSLKEAEEILSLAMDEDINDTRAAAEAKKQYEADVKSLVRSLSGVELATQVNQLTEAWRRLTPAQRDSKESIDRVLEEYGKLREQLSPSQMPKDIEALWQKFVEGPRKAEKELQSFNEVLKETRRIASLLGPTQEETTESFLELSTAFENAGSGARLTDQRLMSVIGQFVEMGERAQAAGYSVDGLTEDLQAAYNLANERGLIAPFDDTEKAVKRLGVAIDETTRRRIIAAEAARIEADAERRAAEEAAAARARQIQSWQDLAQSIRDCIGATGALVDAIAGLTNSQGLATLGDQLGEAGQAANAMSGAMSRDSEGNLHVNPAGMIQGAAGTLGAFNRATNYSSGGRRAAGGALVGAGAGFQIGSNFGPFGMVIGTVAGAVIGGISGFIREPRWVQVGREAGELLGTSISDELAQAIDATAQELGISNRAAALLNLDAAVAESGRAFSTFGDQVVSLMNGVADSTIPAEEGIAAIGSAFQQLEAEGTTAARRIQVQMIQMARESGTAVDELMAAVERGLSDAVEGVTAMTQGIQILTPEDAEAQSYIFAATFWARFREQGVAGIQELVPAFQALQEGLSAGGFDTSAILGPITGMMEMLGNERMAPIVEGVAGLQQALTGLGDAGYMTAGAFQGFQQQAQSAVDQLVAEGAAPAAALTSIAPLLAELQAQSEMYGIQLDANTQSLIDQANAAGIAFPTDPMQRVVDVLEAIAEVLGAELPAAANSCANSMQDSFSSASDSAYMAADNITDALGSLSFDVPVNYYSTGSPGGPPGADVPEMAEGGIAVRPTLRVFGEAGPEAVMPLDVLNERDNARAESDARTQALIANLPRMVSLAIRDALLQVGR